MNAGPKHPKENFSEPLRKSDTNQKEVQNMTSHSISLYPGATDYQLQPNIWRQQKK